MTQYIGQLHNIGLRVNTNNILHDINLLINPNEIITIVGRSGAGKTSLLEIMCGIKQPTCGNIIWSDNITIGYMPQSFKINKLMSLKVLEFLELFSNITIQDNHYVNQLLQLDSLLYKHVCSLSGGELKKVLLANAIMQKPKILILDEPVSNMDVIAENHFYEIINKVKKELQCTIIIVSHDLHVVMSGSNRVICLNKHVCCEGKPCEIALNPEFKKLFGKNYLNNFGLYTHNHSHE